MKYIVGFESGGGRVFAVPMRGEHKTFDYATVWRILQRHFPGRLIYSPLDTPPGKCRVVSVWVSPSRDGVGRIDQQFHEWAVEEK
jgi:hypothetical protein